MVIFGIVAGIFSMLATSKLLGNPPAGWIKRLLNPQMKTPDTRYLQLTNEAITKRIHRSLLMPTAPVLLTALFVTVYFLSDGISTGTWSIGLLIGFLGTVIACYPFMIILPLAEYRKKVSGFAARQLARMAKPEDSGPILIAAAANSDATVRLAAIVGLRELGTKSGIEALRKLAEDKHHEVAVQARDALSDLLPALRGEAMLSVRTMDTYVEEHRFLQKNFKSSDSEKAKRAFEKLHEITLQIDEIVYSQLSVRRAFPDVYCVECYSRAESLHYEEWEWVRCKQCKEVHHLRSGVQKVIGQIGGKPVGSEGLLQNGLLRIDLWDDKSQKGRYGEVDVLEIVGGQPVNYDWAISAVIEKLHNQHQGPVNMLTIKLVDQPKLEVNTLHLLRTLDPGVMG